MNIVVDTGAWYALADSSDAHHEEARSFYEHSATEHTWMTTDLILAETWALISGRLGRDAAVRFWKGLREARISVWTLEPVDLEAAWRILGLSPDQNFSLVDCSTFAFMERFGVHDAFAFDSHFLFYRFGPDRERAFRRHPR